MANLGICRRCKEMKKISPALIDDDGIKMSTSQAWCSLSSSAIEWDSDVPENCIYRMEHMITGDAVSDLAEEAKHIKVGHET